jgi:hypothetical protein
MVNINIAGHKEFHCPVGRTVEEAVGAIRSMYGLLKEMVKQCCLMTQSQLMGIISL